MKIVIKTLNKELEFVRNALRVLDDYEIGDCFTINDVPTQKKAEYRTGRNRWGCIERIYFTGATAHALVARGILEVVYCKKIPLRIKEGVTIKCPINVYRLTKTYADYKKELYQQIEQAF